ncbi:UDP-N-acetylmuramoyl-L-alanine--D-glutamate ligase [Candidatus Tachikawaea gelatinosa]|uniref:UDP-N-acetylmuramoylalanine--D-glutamate ligase n=1 Tax=Candidatus Tachikawaea gelatinosa TaxID=1410383 RepID=A0A090AQ44_9ENTR|nr:UDP-N-acetylmuramoyl-L-alanine--D-glutamate ligase [Candidatus Tachikawaea gelatinosa]BAP58462.1 UDP-N-acetylmuramoylalanine--D-glutamate ligase [Candidatus Tachikawaea gelatinosa]
MFSYSKKKIVIIGIGITGLSCLDFFLRKNIVPYMIDTRQTLPIDIYKKIPKFIKMHLGSFKKEWILTADLIIVSPGVNIKNSMFLEAMKNGVEIISDIELFCRETNLPIIAITGSNGKSTVTTLIGKMIKDSGYIVGIGGNIGFPVLNLLAIKKIQIYVLELSSFQLENTYNLKTQSSSILNITSDHLDRYPLGIKDYRAAKLQIYNDAQNIVVNADDIMTFPINNLHTDFVKFGEKNQQYCLNETKEWIRIDNNNILNVNDLKIIGYHNYINALAALALSETINLPRHYCINTLKNFYGLPHRFQLILEKNNIKWINDSKSTNIGSVQAALKSINCENVLWLLLGGDGKSANFSILKKDLLAKKIRIYSFGRDRKIFESIFSDITICKETLKEAVIEIAKQVKKGDVVLLSPGCASTDQFDNFAHRGNIFTQLAKEFS